MRLLGGFADPELGYARTSMCFHSSTLINELSKNIDGYRLSTYFYKEKDSDGGKIVMEPLVGLQQRWAADTAIREYEGFEVNTVCGNFNPFWWSVCRARHQV